MTSLVPSRLGRYLLYGEIARGGMASVHIGRLTGAIGFARTVAIKRLHPHLAQDQNFVGMFVDEARLASRIRHPNVVDTLDVVLDGRELYIVMEFVLGETFSRIIRGASEDNQRLPPAVSSAIVIGALEGLHAAHEATSENGEALGIVHRDISPQNILVGHDGVPRVLDFGIAKAAGRIQETNSGEVKGKLAYMAPEQLTRGRLDRRCDVFAMSIVLWEALTGRRLFASDDPASTMYAVMHDTVVAPSQVVKGIPAAVDHVVLKGLARDQKDRWTSAREMATALEAACPPASAREVGEWVSRFAAEAISARSELVTQVEKTAAIAEPLLAIPTPGGGHFVGPPTPQPWPLVDPTPSGTMPSAVTSMAATADAQPPPTRKAPLLAMLAVFAALALIGGGLGVFAVVRAKAPASAASAPPPSSEAPPPATVAADPKAEPAPPATSTATAAATTTSAPATNTPTAPTAAAVAANAHKPGPAAKPGTATKPEPAKPEPKKPEPAKPAVDCENPFTIDSNGMKRPKPACFGH